MSARKTLGTFGMLVLGAAMMVPAAKAGESDQLTKMTFDQAFQVPGHVLPAGSYWFKVSGNMNDMQKNVIKIYREDKSHLVATVPALPAQRKNTGYGTAAWTPSMDKTELRIAVGTPQHPAALLTWFYPFGYSGHQFYYPKADRERLREESATTVALNNSNTVKLSALNHSKTVRRSGN